MSVIPISLARISDNLRMFNLLGTIRRSQAGMFTAQNQIASGLRFTSLGQDPPAAAAVARLDRRLDLLGAVGENLTRVNASLAEAENAMQEASNLLTEARSLATQAASDGLSTEERDAIGVAIDSLLRRLVSVANRQHLGQYLFGGQAGDQVPFELTADGVRYNGDAGQRQTIVDSDLSLDAFTLPGSELFAALSDGVKGNVDLDPQITAETLLSDLNGANGQGVRLGRVLVSDGSTQVEIDLTRAVTVGDVIDLLNASLPETLQAALTTSGIQITDTGRGPVSITVTDAAGGTTAQDLGIYTDQPAVIVTGADLDPRLTLRTKIGDLRDGAGVNLADGITISNGGSSAKVDFTGVETVEDLLNRINASNTGVLARISDEGRSIEILNRVSGAELHVLEAGGMVAADLGILSTQRDTRLADLNDGRGVGTVDGDDLRITTADGSTIDIDLDTLDLSSATLGDLIDLINAAAAGKVTAGIDGDTGGLRITDNTAGPGTLAVQKLNLSPALDDLGLSGVSASSGQLVGQDVNPVVVDSAFTALLELKRGLDDDDTRTIGRAAERLERTLEALQQQQGRLAALAASQQERADRIERETTATQVLRSNFRDADLAETIVRFTQLQTSLQANLASSSRILGLSLLNFLS